MTKSLTRTTCNLVSAHLLQVFFPGSLYDGKYQNISLVVSVVSV